IGTRRGLPAPPRLVPMVGNLDRGDDLLPAPDRRGIGLGALSRDLLADPAAAEFDDHLFACAAAFVIAEMHREEREVRVARLDRALADEFSLVDAAVDAVRLAEDVVLAVELQ